MDRDDVSARADREAPGVGALGPLENPKPLPDGPVQGVGVDDLAVDRDREVGASEVMAADELQRRRGEEHVRGDAEQDRGQESQGKGKTGPRRQAPDRVRQANPDSSDGLAETVKSQITAGASARTVLERHVPAILPRQPPSRRPGRPASWRYAGLQAGNDPGRAGRPSRDSGLGPDNRLRTTSGAKGLSGAVAFPWNPGSRPQLNASGGAPRLSE